MTNSFPRRPEQAVALLRHRLENNVQRSLPVEGRLELEVLRQRLVALRSGEKPYRVDASVNRGGLVGFGG